MGITSFHFILFYIAILILYYIVPKKIQWCVLLVASVSYYLLTQNIFLILYPIASVITCYLGMQLIEKADDQKKKRWALIAVLLVNLGILFGVKYLNFGGSLKILVPLGLSFYTFSLLGYVIDVFYGISKAEKNFLRLALFGMYFPVLISGPIMKFRDYGETFFHEHKFDYKQVTFGMQRMLWGFFKVLVISERMALIVNTVYGDYKKYPGAYIWLATICFAFQLYTNFSGSMDIVIGLSQTFGIILPENFDTPYFSTTISEYWRRWHITLGVWMKDYVFYPLLRSSAFTKLAKNFKNRFGKKRGKQYTTFLAMFILWFSVGLWHGGDLKFVIGSGLLHWFYIVSGELLQPTFDVIMDKLHINAKGKMMHCVRVVRTFLLVCIGFVFFRAASTMDALKMLASSVSTWNLPELFGSNLFMLGLDWIEFTIAVVSLLILLVVSILQQKGSVRERIAIKALPIRWVLFYALLFYVILLGYYGPGFSATEFIYQAF